jgi:hypothetical protein
MLQRLWHSPLRPIDSMRPPLQSLPIPLDIVHLMIDDYFDHPPDLDTLKALSLACQALLAYCHAILFRRMRIGWSHESERIHRFASDFSSSNTLDLVTDLSITFPPFSKLAHAPGLGSYDRLVVPWVQVLRQSKFPHLDKLIVWSDAHGSSLPATVRHTLIRLVERASAIHLLDLQHNTPSFSLPILSFGARFSTIVNLCISAEAWSAFHGTPDEVFPLLRALTLNGTPEVPPVDHPRCTALLHLALTAHYFPGHNFGPPHNVVMRAYSQTLRCLHINKGALSHSFRLTAHWSRYIQHPIALHDLPSLEYLEITTGFSRDPLPHMLTWISDSVAQIPPSSLSAVLRQLRIVIIIEHGAATPDRLESFFELEAKNTWRHLTVITFQNRWPNLCKARVSGYYRLYQHCTPSKRNPSWPPRLKGPYAMEGSTHIERPLTQQTRCIWSGMSEFD